MCWPKPKFWLIKGKILRGLFRRKFKTDIFNFEKTFEEADIIKLLFYMYWLTIKEKEAGYHAFKIPNHVIRELYYDYFVAISEQESQLNRAHGDISTALFQLAL